MIMKTAPIFIAVIFFCTQAAADEKSAKWLDIAEHGAFCNEGAIQLAHSGIASLPLLESWYATKTDRVANRVDAILSMALLLTIQPTDIDAYPNLSRLAQTHYKQAEPFVEILKNASGHDFNDTELTPPGAPPQLSKERKAFYALLDMRGFAVKPALQLIDMPSPFAKGYGLEILRTIQAMSQLPILLKLSSPKSLNTAGNFAVKLDPTYPNKEYAPAFEAEQYISELCEGMDFKHYTGLFPVGNELRQQGKTLESKSWDEYWNKAGPVIEKIYNETPIPTRRE